MTATADDHYPEPSHATAADIELAHVIADIEAAAANTLRALGDITGAWHNLTAGQPGYHGTRDPELGTRTSPPESFETILADPAITDLEQLRRRTRSVHNHAAALHQLITTWATADTPPAAAGVDPNDWCDSCLRIGKCSPRYRGVLCRWCFDFNAVEHMRPPPRLLELHHQGVKITDKLIREHRPLKRSKRPKARS